MQIKYKVEEMSSEEIVPLMSLDDDMINSDENHDGSLPILALRNTVLFPGVVIPITIGRDKSVKAIKAADKGSKTIVVVSQKDQKIEDPEIKDLYDIGVAAKIVKVLTMPDGSTTAIIQGRKRVRINSITSEEPFLLGNVTTLADDKEDNKEITAMAAAIKDAANKVIDYSPNLPPEAAMMLKNIENNLFLMYFIASNLKAPVSLKQEILTISDNVKKGELILKQLKSEVSMLELKNKIESKVKTDIEKQQRDYFLNQQLRTIQEELGGNTQEEEIKKFEARAKKKNWPARVAKLFQKDLQKLRRINPQVPEYSLMMNYLEMMLELPWDDVSTDNFDLHKIRKHLDSEHYGLDKVKERIIEHLAVLKLKGDLKAPILCLVGPPGVGKTSLGKSIADALGRSFIRMSLGGLHDESELRGHRKTYIGAMPGRIIQSIKKAGSSNPVFILDEIDKLGRDHRGDPSSALLEILDPEQNHSFYDNYLETEYDLSKVMFIATANSLSSIQPALLDRMEIIDINGYSNEEKVEIAKKHLIPKQREAHGLLAKDIKLTAKGLEKVIYSYTKESGVRSLDRQLAALMRNIARKKAMEETYNQSIGEQDVIDILGPEKFMEDQYVALKHPGVAVGLAWTRVGGDILFIESNVSRGKGKLTLTGNLGDVMKESATTALSYIKAHATNLGITDDYFDQHDIHVHVPEGAIPKDGPSAGITMLTSITSSIIGKASKPYQAMTGEITLRGKVLPVGGIKEKILAAKRSGIKEIILCEDNKRHVDEINPDFLKGLSFTYVSDMTDVLAKTLSIG